MQNNPVAIVLLDLAGLVTSCNPAFEALFGYSCAEMQGRHIDLFITNDDDYQEALDYTERVTHGETISITSRRWRRDGSPVIVESQGVPMMVDGELTGVLTLYHDVSHLKQAEQAQREMSQSFARIMDSLNADIYVSSMETYEILFMNSHMRQSFGEGIVGGICYRHFRDLDAPCPHCTNPLLLDQDGAPNQPVVWEGQNPITQRWYQNSDCAIRWGQAGYVRLQIATDITELKSAELHMAHMATHDALTGLPNRFLLGDRIAHALEVAKRRGTSIGLLFIDMDELKQVNDSLGHSVGDQMLQEVASRMRACVRDCDTVARVAGDEFVVLLEEGQDDFRPTVVAERLLEAIRQPLVLERTKLTTTASIGIGCYPRDGQTADTLLERADDAMYAVKRAGGNDYSLVSTSLS